MGLPISIDMLLHGKAVEWERLEFKAGWNPLDVLQTICAFANDFHNLGGGYIVVGVEEEDGCPLLPPVGIESTQLNAIQKEILSLGHNAMQPQYHPIVVPEMVAGKHVLIIWAPGGATRPYKAKLGLGKACNNWGYFIRKGSSTVRAKGADETELLSLAATIPFDDQINQRASLDDLSRDLIADFLEEVDSPLAAPAKDLDMAELGRQMQIVDGPDEEAVANAVYHRGYDVREPIEVRIGRDEIVVLSYPGPDRSVRLEELRAGRALPRRYRNRRIGEFLKELDITEGRSTGIPKILHAMQQNGSPSPVFDFDENHTFFMCRLPVHPQATMPEGLIEQEGSSAEAQVTPTVTPTVTSTVIALLKLLNSSGECGNAEVRSAFSLKDRGHLHKSYLQPALQVGLIEMTIPEKPNSRLQKYRLTVKGRAFLESMGNTEDGAAR